MKVILQKDVKDLGKIGDVVQVSSGHARNLLLPKKLAMVATENNMKQWKHLEKVAEIKTKKARSQRQEFLDKISGQSVVFKVQAQEDKKLFGSVSALDISEKLSKLGFEVDKKDITLECPIKSLGEYTAYIQYNPEQKVEISVTVEKA